MRINVTSEDVQKRFASLIDARKPELAGWLLELRETTLENVLTMDEVRKIVESGEIEPQWLAYWRNQYSEFVEHKVKPVWERAIASGHALTGERLSAVFGGRGVLDYESALLGYMATRGGELAVQLSESQHIAMRTILTNALREGQTVDEIKQRLALCVGLVERDACAIIKYRERLRGVLNERELNRRVQKYYARHLRYRSERIIRTEVAKAYNYAQDAVVKDWLSQNPGVQMIKRWRLGGSAPCAICLSLDGLEVGINGKYEITGGEAEYPPAHPHCYCYVAYEAEVS